MEKTQPSARTGAIVVVASLVCVLGFLECTSRLLSPDQFHVWPPGFEQTFDIAPGLVHGVEFPSQLTINDLGMRGSMPKDSQYHLLAIGGSTTICGMLDDSKAWPWRLQETLNASLGKDATWVGNVGRPGHGTTHHIAQTEKLLEQHEFVDAIVLLVGANDMLISFSLVDKDFARDFFRNKPSPQETLAMTFAVTPDSEEHLPWYSRNFISRTSRRLGTVSSERAGGLPPMDRTGDFMKAVRGYRKSASVYKSELPDLSRALVNYKKRLEQIIDIGSAAGVRVIFLTQPSLWRAGLDQAELDLLWMGGPPLNRLADSASYYSVEVLAGAMKAFNDTVLEVCESRGVECIDTATAVPRDLKFFYDDAHFTEEGAERMALTVANQLLKSEPLTRASKRGNE